MRLTWKKRLQFARKHKDWTLEQWKVMWSDESRFTLFQSDGCTLKKRRVRRGADEVMHPSCLGPTVQVCEGSVMIWGCCSWSGLEVWVQHYVSREWGQLTTWIYWMTKLFHLWTFFLLWWLGHNPRSQCQDSLGPNWVRLVQGAWDKSFPHVDWPRESPDLNLFGNLCDVLEKTLPSSMQGLGEKLIQLWTEINVVTLQNRMETMSWRMHVVVKAKGGAVYNFGVISQFL